MNRDMTLLDRYGGNIKDVKKYFDRVEIINTNILEKLDFSKKFDLD